MIDFRFHIISIVAVFLALGLGILMGSGFLGDVLIEDLERQIDNVKETNRELRDQVTALEARLDAGRSFMEDVQPRLIDQALRDQNVVLFELSGTDGEMTDGIVASVEEADGTVAARIRLDDKLALESEAEHDQLAFIVDSTASDSEGLLEDAGFVLGSRVAVAAHASRERPNALARLQELLSELDDAGFVSVDAPDGGSTVPSGAVFVIVGGGSDEPAYDARSIASALATGIAGRNEVVMVAESFTADWGLVADIRSDEGAQGIVATVDQAESIPGRIAVVLGLREEVFGTDEPAGHYGVRSGAAGVLPETERGP